MMKNCTACGSSFEKKGVESQKYWATKKFCSQSCYWLDKKNKMPAHLKPFTGEEGMKSRFKKGQTSIRKGAKQPWTDEVREKHIMTATRGEIHWNWKGGITKESEKIRKSRAYAEWRMAIYRRDHFSCVLCGYKGKGIEADHIKAFYLYPELRLSIDNGRTLCKPCHRNTETWGRKVYLLKREVVGANI